jgi:hypothetical protein
VCTSFIQRFGVLTRLSHTMTKLSWCVFVRRFIYRCCGSNGTRSPAHQHYLVWAVCCILEGDIRTILFVARFSQLGFASGNPSWTLGSANDRLSTEAFRSAVLTASVTGHRQHVFTNARCCQLRVAAQRLLVGTCRSTAALWLHKCCHKQLVRNLRYQHERLALWTVSSQPRVNNVSVADPPDGSLL